MIGRRALLTGTVAAGVLPIAFRQTARAQSLDETPLRPGLLAGSAGLAADAETDQTEALQALVDEAARTDMPLILAAGSYRVRGLTLPDRTRIAGVHGATRLVLTGSTGIVADGVGRIEISNLVIDGSRATLERRETGLLYLANVETVALDGIEVTGSSGHGVMLERCGGSVSRCHLSGAAEAGLFAVECRGLAVADNIVDACGNGGILIHRWEKGDDGTMVRGNRVSGIAANSGGTGENGNGINVFRANNVMVSDNHISDCAFSAIRANSASNVTISGNHCLRSGETAVYAEFGFEGALISGNLVDGAANGIVVCNFDEGGRLSVVSGNLVRNLSLKGPYVHDGAGFGSGITVEADTGVYGNVVENAERCGLMVGWGEYLRNVSVTGNVVRKAPIGAYLSVVEGVGEAIFTGNLFADTPDGAIVGYRWNEKVTGDLLVDPALAQKLTLSGNVSRR